jgi:hypothetical protein
LCAKAQPGFEPAAERGLNPAAESEPGFQSCAEPRLEAAAETAARLQAHAFIAREPELIGHRLLQTGNRITITETQPWHSGGGR